eukprot:scaffold483563_cov21-Prasinocladus_malaysianus.AAC.1
MLATIPKGIAEIEKAQKTSSREHFCFTSSLAKRTQSLPGGMVGLCFPFSTLVRQARAKCVPDTRARACCVCVQGLHGAANADDAHNIE